MIARIISEARAGPEYVPHSAIVAALLRAADGRKLVEAAHRKKPYGLEWWASNMVQWFSHRFEDKRFDHAEEFQRTIQDKRWAYRKRPVMTTVRARRAPAKCSR